MAPSRSSVPEGFCTLRSAGAIPTLVREPDAGEQDRVPLLQAEHLLRVKALGLGSSQLVPAAAELLGGAAPPHFDAPSPTTLRVAVEMFCFFQGTPELLIHTRLAEELSVCGMVQDRDEIWDGFFGCCLTSKETVLVQNPMQNPIERVRRGIPVTDSNKWPQWRSREPKSPSSPAEAQKSSVGDGDTDHDDNKKV